MSESTYQLQTFGEAGDDGAEQSKDDKASVQVSFRDDEEAPYTDGQTVPLNDDETTPLRDDENANLTKDDTQPSIFTRMGRAFSTALFYIPMPSFKLLALWGICAGLLKLHLDLLHRWPQGDYGIGVLKESMDCGSHGAAYMAFAVQLPTNILATFLATALGSARASMAIDAARLADSGMLVLAIPLYILQIVPLLMTIPTHLLYNSLIFRSTSAYDSYEVLVSDSFLHQNSTPFDLSILPLHPTSGHVNPLRNDYNMMPPGLNSLTDSIMQLRTALVSNHSHAEWENLTFSSCQNRYKDGTYESFSNVVLISNYTSPSTANNSALELTVLSGQAGPRHQTAQKLVSLCPESFLSTHNSTEPEWKYVPSKASGLFDAYAPKNFPVKDQNVFVKSCFSQDVPQKCRLLYSPLVLRVATVCLMVTVGCMTFAALFCGWTLRKSADLEKFEEMVSMSSETQTGVFFGGAILAFTAFVIQLFVMAFSAAAQREPSGKSDQRWLLNVSPDTNIPRRPMKYPFHRIEDHQH
ncbi:uncharacterized protein LY89DRAFT_196973 [Mollisia scopiformis]|uniref:Uncharacterized protein n=1 Tax=Mollisia scopiformis TaxID=149040 RepID=A0A194WYA6_MOLSC|nr:uncharacterized protein LY89DRAFT_196973 [Mollisia scopiformis]KUJ12920.1 hypothetical protein LY89DRAFT_196973 [Mollisia scopiformis]